MLRHSKYVKGKSAAKSYVEHINIVQTVKQIGQNATVRKQEEEIVVGIVLVIVDAHVWHGRRTETMR